MCAVCDESSQFRCDNGKCIALSLQCNRYNDCGDAGSDEMDCGESFIVLYVSVPAASVFACMCLCLYECLCICVFVCLSIHYIFKTNVIVEM